MFPNDSDILVPVPLRITKVGNIFGYTKCVVNTSVYIKDKLVSGVEIWE